MSKNTKFLYFLPLLCLTYMGCGDVEAELKRIREETNDAQINRPAPTQARCRGDEDKPLMRADNIEFARKMEKCVVKDIRVDFWNSTAHLDMPCFKGHYPKMSDGCVDCFAQLTKCTADNCKADCMMDSAGDACTRCSTENCRDLMWACSGVLHSDLPRLRSN